MFDRDYSLSSAKRHGLHDVELERSFTYMWKRRGPKIEPWGTLMLIGVEVEWQLFKDTN